LIIIIFILLVNQGMTRNDTNRVMRLAVRQSSEDRVLV